MIRVDEEAERLSGLAGKTVLLTGAAGEIGAATAGELVRRGARVALLDVDLEGLDVVGRALGDAVCCLAGDVTSEGDVGVAVDAAVAWVGRIDAVVVNAAINHIAPLGELEVEDFDRVVAVNLGGAVRTVCATLPHVRMTRGYVVLVCSGAGLVQGPFQAAYNASKAGLHAFGNTLRQEVAHDGVDVGIAYFNAVDTTAARDAIHHPLMAPLKVDKLMTPRPVEEAAVALADGIERRSKVVFVPRSARLAAGVPSVLQRVTDRWVARRLNR